LLQKWPRIIYDVEDDAYETLVFAYNRKLDVIVSVSSITRSDVEEESSPTYPKDAMTNSKKEMMNLEETTHATTP
jgi:Leucine-rich repeat (LRR) protein